MLENLLLSLLNGEGARLALESFECQSSIVQASVNILSQAEAKEALISRNLVLKFANLGTTIWATGHSRLDDIDDGNASANWPQTQQAVLQTLYDISAMSDFTTKYTTDTRVKDVCIKNIQGENALQRREHLSQAAACGILANLTRSSDFAENLVRQYNIHNDLKRILRDSKQPDVLYATANLVGRLALPAANKNILTEYGMIGTMNRLFAMETDPAIQREAVSVCRRLISGSSKTLDLIRPCCTENEVASILALFKRTNDAATKFEIGRFAIELCRALWASKNGRPEAAETTFLSVIPPQSELFAESIAFVACKSDSDASRGEGWFGLAMLSVWETGREMIFKCLTNRSLSDEFGHVARRGGGPSYQNLRLILAKLSLSPVSLNVGWQTD